MRPRKGRHYMGQKSVGQKSEAHTGLAGLRKTDFWDVSDGFGNTVDSLLFPGKRFDD